MSQLTDLFQNIANEIRGKSGKSAQLAAINFPDAIASIPTGSRYVGEFYVNSDGNKLDPLPASCSGASLIYIVLIPKMTPDNEDRLFYGVWSKSAQPNIKSISTTGFSTHSGSLSYNDSTRVLTSTTKLFSSPYYAYVWK